MSLAKPILAELDTFEDQGADTCLTCPGLCRWSCPVAEAEARETVSPHGLVVLSGLLKRGIASVESAGDHPFRCSQCGACTEACLHRNDVPLLLDLARSRVVAGHGAPAAVGEVRGNFGVAGNPQGAALDGILARSPPTRTSTSRGAATPSTSRAATRSTGARRPRPRSCGRRCSSASRGWRSRRSPPPAAVSPLLWAGDLEAFAVHAARFANQVRDIGTLVVHDAACAEALVRRYRVFGVELAPAIRHVAAFFAEKLGSPKTAADGAAKRTVAYHDALVGRK